MSGVGPGRVGVGPRRVGVGPGTVRVGLVSWSRFSYRVGVGSAIGLE